MIQKTRRDEARSVRHSAAVLVRGRPDVVHRANCDENDYRSAHFAMTFTKGLEHDADTLLVKDSAHAQAFRDAIDGGLVSGFNRIARPVPNPTTNLPKPGDPVRKWEAPTAGFVHDLQGPDAQEVTMPPAPALGSRELIYEMAEVYELALLRDVDFSQFASGKGDTNVRDALARLKAHGRPGVDFPCRPRILENGKIIEQNLFRGSSRGVDVGPYVSQFLLMGTETLDGGSPAEGQIMYGAQRIDQRVPVAVPGKDYMVDEGSYLEVQNGINVRDNSVLFGDPLQWRFIQTPRDLASYVHDDALYQAYLNACLILLAQGAPFDPCFDELSGMGTHGDSNTGGFALWGGPHILSLLTEVATRALKAVRYQKFNVHLRLRPEALGARVHKFAFLPNGTTRQPQFATLTGHLQNMLQVFQQQPDGASQSLANAVQAHTRGAGSTGGTLLLPMAFQEGSPMHPSYGAGHAAVAGACVTVLKAWFDTSAVLLERPDPKCPEKPRIGFDRRRRVDTPVHFEVSSGQGKNCLKKMNSSGPLTLEGELNKLAANISIGRNMAGVHYFSDYYDSLRMGEEVAIGILEEQALTYPKDRFRMSLVTFDGDVRRL